MKKKINGLAELTDQFIQEGNIPFRSFINLFTPYIKIERISMLERRESEWDSKRPDGTKFKDTIICILDIKVKKKDRKKIKRILSSKQDDNILTLFYRIEFDENDKQISKIMYFRNNQMYRIRNFKLYDFLFEFRKLLPNLLIDLEMMLMRSL